MRAVVQRVSEAKVEVDGQIIGQIGAGVLVLLAIANNDQLEAIDKMAAKIANLRLFADAAGKMNLSLIDVGGQVLVVSQFTLLADCQKGKRPSFGLAASADKAEDYYQQFIRRLKAKGLKVQTGRFGAKMQVSLINDGPVTFIIDY